MQTNEPHLWRINQLFLFLGMLSIVFAVLKMASDIVVPLLIAIAIAILLLPLLAFFERRKVPRSIALILIIVTSIGIELGIGIFLVNEVDSFTHDSQSLASQLQSISDRVINQLIGYGLPIKNKDLLAIFNPSNLVGFFQSTLMQLGNQLSNIMLILFMAIFIVMESGYMYIKLQKTLNDSERLEASIEIISKIKTYFVIKAKISLLTALCAFIVLWYFDVSYPLLWATVTFFLNFIPVFGSIIAAIPPVILAVLDQGVMSGVWVMLWYIIINNVIGNIIEPGLMGRGLGLSSLTVFLSMTFWGWMFGPAGMILSVPLTMAFQFLLMQYEETKWLGFMMSDYQG